MLNIFEYIGQGAFVAIILFILFVYPFCEFGASKTPFEK